MKCTTTLMLKEVNRRPNPQCKGESINSRRMTRPWEWCLITDNVNLRGVLLNAKDYLSLLSPGFTVILRSKTWRVGGDLTAVFRTDHGSAELV